MKSGFIGSAVVFGLAVAAVAAIPYERPVAAPTYGAALDVPGVAAVASDGRDALLVWHAWLRGAIYAARLSADGSLRDPAGIRIASVPLRDGSRDETVGPWVFRAGVAYVIFWNDEGVKCARVDGDGNVVDAPHLSLAGATISSVATNGACFVASYDGGRLAVFDLAGRLRESGIAVPGVNASGMTLTSNGSGFLATWAVVNPVASALNAIALDAAGHPAGSPRLIDVPLATPYVQASNGADYLVIYAQRYIGTRYALHISAAGDVLESRLLPAEPSIDSDGLAWSGSAYIYTFNSPQGIAALRLSAAGAPAGAAPALLAQTVGNHRIAAAGVGLVLTWGDSDIHAEIVSPASLTHTPPMLVSVSATSQRMPAIAFSGRNYLVAWLDGSAGVRAARIDLVGRVLDPGGIKLTDTGGFPKVAFDGKNFVVSSWDSGMNAIDPDTGSLLSSDPLTAAYGRVADLASDGNVTMVVYDSGNGALRALRLNRQLQPLEAPLAITPRGMIGGNPTVAWSGKEWLVAFDERPATGGFNVRAVRISPAMSLLDTEPILVAEGNAVRPFVASSGDDFLVAWTRGISYDLFARHMLSDGTLGKEIPLGSAGSYVSSTIWTGQSYALAFPSDGGDAIGMMLGKFGVTAPGAAFPISTTADRETEPALVAANGRITAAYMRQASEALYGGAYRVFVRDAPPLRGRAAAH